MTSILDATTSLYRRISMLRAIFNDQTTSRPMPIQLGRTTRPVPAGWRRFVNTHQVIRYGTRRVFTANRTKTHSRIADGKLRGDGDDPKATMRIATHASTFRTLRTARHCPHAAIGCNKRAETQRGGCPYRSIRGLRIRVRCRQASDVARNCGR